jgi:glycosyltransferase involved in cell wall biosynthesis
MYSEKRLPFLLEATDYLAEQLPKFTLVIAGSGPERPRLQAISRHRKYLEWHDSVEGAEKWSLFARAELVLMPGLVGLVAVDAMAHGRPVVTIVDSKHSPEFEYLDASNSLLLPPGTNPRAYGEAVIDLLTNQARLEAMRDAARSRARSLTLDEMVTRFGDGIIRALD